MVQDGLELLPVAAVAMLKGGSLSKEVRVGQLGFLMVALELILGTGRLKLSVASMEGHIRVFLFRQARVLILLMVDMVDIVTTAIEVDTVEVYVVDIMVDTGVEFLEEEAIQMDKIEARMKVAMQISLMGFVVDMLK